MGGLQPRFQKLGSVPRRAHLPSVWMRCQWHSTLNLWRQQHPERLADCEAYVLGAGSLVANGHCIAVKRCMPLSTSLLCTVPLDFIQTPSTMARKHMESIHFPSTMSELTYQSRCSHAIIFPQTRSTLSQHDDWQSLCPSFNDTLTVYAAFDCPLQLCFRQHREVASGASSSLHVDHVMYGHCGF